MKRFIIFLVSALVCSSAFCEILTPEAALNRALSNNSSTAKHIKSINQGTVTPKLLNTITANNLPAVYLFDRGNNSGYLVLSADDSADAILGYCDEGTIDVNNMPPAMSFLLQSYADQIAIARSSKGTRTVQAKAHQVPEREAIHPMCESRWGLGSPFNGKTPNAYQTGCVATALAQVLKHYNYPTKGTGTASYTWNDQTLSYDFDNSTFDWDNMLNVYGNDATDAQKEAVSDLMYACGVTVQMNYKSGGSGAYAINIVKSSANYFNLDKSIRYCVRDYHEYEEWNDIIYDALKNCGPVMLGGCILNTLYTFAHEFVCDGYADNNLFHINWGWTGNYDGYFRLEALDPYSYGIEPEKSGYNYYQDVVAYIQPAKADSKVFEQMYSSEFKIQNTSANLGGTALIKTDVINYSSAPISGVSGIKISDINGNLVQYVGGKKFTDLALTSSISITSVTIPSDLEDGTYTVTPAFQGSDGEWHDVHVKITAVQSYTMNVANGKATFSADAAGTIKVEDFKLATPLYASPSSYNIPFRLDAKITCPDKHEYYGKLAMALYDTNDNLISTYSYTPLYLPAGETVDFSLYDSSTTITAGTSYKMALVDGAKNIVSDKIDVTVDEFTDSERWKGPTWKAEFSNMSIKDADNVDPHDIEINFTASCTEGFLFEPVWLYIYDEDDTIVNSNWGIYPLVMVAGESKDITFHGDFPNAVVGETYRVYGLSSVNAKWLNTKACKFTVGGETGVNNITDDSVKAVKTEYYNLQGVNLGATAPSHGLYIKAETFSNGERRTSRCIIK